MVDDTKWHLIHSRLHRHQAVQVTSILEDAGIESIVIKGIAIERFYPSDTPRPSVDLDIAVAPHDFEKARELLLAGKLGNALVDLHEGLRHFDSRPWKEIYGHTELVEFEDGAIRVLCPEDQLRVVCVHWLTDGGEKKERLWDIHHIIRIESEDIDWDYCLNANSSTRRGWIICAIGLAARYTGLDISKLPFREEAETVPSWVIRTLEDRWKDEIPFSPLDNNFASWGQFFRQLRRRFPPNAVMATVGLEGEFDNSSRVSYQIRYFFFRFFPTAIRTIRSYFRRKLL